MNRSWTRYLPTALRGKLEGRHDLQGILSNAGWLLADNALRMGGGLLIGIWVTRYLGPERYGLLSYAVAFVTIFSSIAMLGLDGIVIRNLARDPARRDETLGSTFALKLVGSILAAGSALVAIFLMHPGDRETCLLVAITALGQLFQAFGTIDFWFQSQVRSKYSAYARSGAFLLSSAGKIVLIVCQAPLAAFAWIGVADTLLGALGLVASYRASGYRLGEWRPTATMARELMRDSWPLIFTEVVIMVYLRVDRIIIGEMAGNAELGIYSVAALMAEALTLVPRIAGSSLFPGIVQAKAVSDDFFRGRLQRFYNLMALLSYAIALPVTLLAGWGIPLLFGAAYAKAAPMLIGLAWAALFGNLWVARSYFLTAMNWTRLHFITDFVGCVINVALNVLLIPRYGGMGAVIATGATYWFVTHGSCFLFEPLRPTGAMLTRAIICPTIGRWDHHA